jgi:hypothetical protein
MEFVEAPVFTRYLSDYMSDEELRRLQAFLMVKPKAGDVIQGTGGFRKLRWSDQHRGKGKRGGLRVIYYLFPEERQIWLMTVYGKDEAEDLSVDQKKALREAITREKKARTKNRSRHEKR